MKQFALRLPDDLWRRVTDYRFKKRIPSSNEAINKLLEAGLKKEKKKA